LKFASQQLQSNLQRKLESIYLIAGDEPLLVGEALQRVRDAARGQNYLERSLHVVDRGFRWSDLAHDADNLSLFAARKILELRLAAPRPGDAGAAAIRDLAEDSDPDRVVLIGVMTKLDASAARSQWVKAVEKHGAVVDVWPIARNDLPRWIEARAKTAGFELSRAAAELLADRVEGNLLAADQEIQKLGLLHASELIGEDSVLAAVANSARFDVFRLSDAVMAGEAARALRVLAALREDGTQPALVSWALLREIALLARLSLAVERGVPIERALKENGVWQSRQGLVSSAVRRHQSSDYGSLLSQAADVDNIVKGAKFGRPWDALTNLVLEALYPRLVLRAGGRVA